MTEVLAKIDHVEARVYRIATDAPEADGTLAWNATTIVLVEISGGGETGLGYSYASQAAADVVNDTLSGVVEGGDAFDIPRHWTAMVGAVRNIGWRGVAATAISAVDTALWDLKAKCLGLPVASLLGQTRNSLPIYGSGGFTTYSEERLESQLARWVEQDGCHAVKMKIGSRPDEDIDRVRRARASIGDRELYVDANGAFSSKAALRMAETLSTFAVTWFEEPVSSDNLDGLRLVRSQGPAGMDIAAGEYGYDPFYFRQMLEAGAVDVLQADATRCGGITGFLKAAALAEAHDIPFSAHTAPALHLHPGMALTHLKNIEWFHDHVRIEHMLFDGAPVPQDGTIRPDPSRPGLGLELKRQNAEAFAA